MSRIEDSAYMEMAFALAEKARGRVSPNPCVGAVIVSGNRIVGHGWHEGPGKPHAEIVALEQAGSMALGATLYSTLEPCTHWGRTPPCIDRILEAGFQRIVISDIDPNPKVAGRGVEKLKEAGIVTSLGLLEARNRRLNRAYTKYITQRKPLVLLKAALSLDGKLAASTGHSQWISSEETRDYIHLVRGEHDALMVGIGTVLQDDPRLTVRHPAWQGKAIRRIVLDSRLRCPLDRRLISNPEAGPVLIFSLETAPQDKAVALRRKGVEVIALPGSRLEIDDILTGLAEREITSVMVEGGGRLHTAFLESGVADEILLSISPKLIGGQEAPMLFQGGGASTVDDSLRLRNIRSFRLNDDIIIEGQI